MAIEIHEGAVGAALNDAALVHNPDLVGLLDGAQAVGDGEGGQAMAHVFDDRLDLGLGFGIDVGGGFVQQQEFRFQVEHPREGQQLPLAGAELLAALADLGFEPHRKAAHEVLQLALFQHRSEALLIALPSHDDVVFERAGENKNILEHQAEKRTMAEEFQFPHIHTIHRYFSRAHIVKPHEQIDERALTRAGVTDHRDATTFGDGAAQFIHDAAAAFLVGEGNIFETDLSFEFHGPRRIRLMDLIPIVQQHEDALAGRHGRLHHVIAFGQFAYGSEEPPRDLHKRKEQAPGEGAHFQLDAAVVDDGRQGGGGNKLHHRKEHRIRENRAQERVQVAAIELLEPCVAIRFAGVHLHQADARELLLKIGLDGGVAALGFAKGFAGLAAEDFCGHQQRRHDGQRHHRQANVLAEHPDDNGQQGHGIPHDGHKAR